MSEAPLQRFIEDISSETHKKWVMEYLKGVAISDIAQKAGRPASMVSMILKTIFKQPIEYYALLYAEAFQKYNFDADTFTAITGEPVLVYQYLSKVYPHGRRNLQAIVDDRTVPPEWIKAYHRYTRGIKKAETPEKTVKSARYRAKEKKIFNRVKKRIHDQFDRKFYIGDILIRDNEYAELISYARVQAMYITSSQAVIPDEPIFAVALVQIGIRHYDGNFWANAAKELGMDPKGQTFQTYAGKTFISTLKKHDKFVISENERVHSILFHSFVSNYYSKGLYELLFQYYVQDLERDINRNTREQMQALIETLQKTSDLGEKGSESFANQFTGKGSRAYRLKYHTLAAISANPSHAKSRLGRLIRLIDRAFWKNETPANPKSRLTILFKEWCMESPSFSNEHGMYIRGDIKNRGKKHFSEPYLFADIENCSFQLRLPRQLVREEFTTGLRWEIRTDQREIVCNADTFLAVTARKTEEQSVAIYREELFGEISIRLVCSTGTVRRFTTIPACPYRFFDMEGDVSSRLFAIPMCAFTSSQDTVQSAAMIDQLRFGGLTRWDFAFEDGDVVILPDKTAMVVGERFRDGFLPRNIVPTVSYADESSTCNVYKDYPELLLTIPKSKVNGTVIEVNGHRMSLGRCIAQSFDVKDSKADEGFLVPISQFPEVQDCTLNTLRLDIPGSKYQKLYRFCMIQGFYAQFWGAPYVFDDHAVVSFPDSLPIGCCAENVQKTPGENSFTLTLSPAMHSLTVTVGDQGLQLLLNVPVLMWSTDRKEWSIAAMGEQWHTNLPKKLFFKSPEKKLYLETDFDSGDDEDDESHVVRADSGADGIMSVDLARFHSWLTRDQIAHNLTLRLNKTPYHFGKVYTRSYVAYFATEVSFDDRRVSIRTDILGQALYFVDVRNKASGELLAEKLPIRNGQAVIPMEHMSGCFIFELFEAEEDDSGFDDYEYYSIYTHEETLVDKSDLTGKHLHITQLLYKRLDRRFLLDADYWVQNLRKIAHGLYTGQLQVGNNPQRRELQITFPDINDPTRFHIEFWDEEEEAFLDYDFDMEQMILIREEPQNMKRVIRYRRYRLLEPEDYEFVGEVTDDVQPSGGTVWTKQKSLPISQSTLSAESKYALMDAGYMYLDELMNLTPHRLECIRGIDYRQAMIITRYFEHIRKAEERKGANEI